MTTQFQPTAQNMVQEVKNIIEGYRMGALRALAQDPVQNSLDAQEGNSVVRVEYCLNVRESRHGTPIYLLTVTDSGTSGLSGEIMTLPQLQSRHYRLNESERWAAFEAQGFTKSGDDMIGSRGQGKSAFLYQSKVPPPGNEPDEERMLMLYDTLLPDGEYRLGVRFASPADVVRTPFIGRHAIETLISKFFRVDSSIDPDLEVPMGFDPLNEVGTRVIIPFLSSETVQAIRDGTLAKWVERCWWRPIQKGELRVSIRLPNGETNRVGVPQWWRGEPWQDPNREDVAEFEDLAVDGSGDLKIKRLVLLHQEELEEPEELHSTIPEYSGVQLLRHGQWVETLGAKSEFADIIPFAHRGQFRGFAEFNDALNGRLRSIERPQHDSFDGRHTEVKHISAKIAECVRKFARSRGWPIADEFTSSGKDIPDADLMSNIIASFIYPTPLSATSANNGLSTREDIDVEPEWELDFGVQYPSDGTSRVNWDERIEAIYAKCVHDPGDLDLSANVRLQIKDATGRYETLQQKYSTTSMGEAMVLFDDIKIVQSKHRSIIDSSSVECPTPGKYTLRAVAISNGKEVASQSLPLFVEEDPPQPPERNRQSVAIRIVNETSGIDLTSSPSRISDGDVVGITVVGTNRDYRETHCQLDVSIRAFIADNDDTLLLADETDHALPGDVPGGTGVKKELLRESVRIFTERPDGEIQEPHIVLPPGRHRISADLFVVASDAPPAHASKNIYVEVDPASRGTSMPFRFNPVDVATDPMWKLDEDPIGSDEWVLSYNRSNSLFQQTVGVSGSLLSKRAFYGHICIEALIDWVLIPYLDSNDESNLDVLRESAGSFSSADMQERYLSTIDQLVNDSGSASSPSSYAMVLNKYRSSMAGIMNNVMRQREQ